MYKLPNNPSELILLALHDLELCEKDDRYKIEMVYWHVPRTKGYCHVCLGGSVMAKTLDCDPSKDINPLDTKFHKQLNALDQFRKGNIICLKWNVYLKYFQLVRN